MVCSSSLVQRQQARLSSAEAEIAALKRAVKKQDRRITALEETVHALQQQAQTAAATPAKVAPSSQSGVPSRPWAIPANWDKVK